MSLQPQPFIYGLVDPLDPKHVRYVGLATRAQRPYAHSKWAHWSNTTSSHFVHWIKKLHTEGREYQVLILEQLAEGTPTKFLGEVEKMYISSLQQIGHQLTNISPGGLGGNVWQWTDEAKEKQRQFRLGRKESDETKEKVGLASASREKTPEWRAKISASLTGRKISEEARKNRLGCQNALGAIHSKESIERVRQKQIGSKASEETKAKMRASQLARWAKRKGNV